MEEVQRVTLEPAIVRGAMPGVALRGLFDLAAGEATEHAAWWANAVASILGQLAVTAPATSRAVLADVCAQAARRSSLHGVESVLLSAVLGTEATVREQAQAEELWAKHYEGAGLPVPVVDPRAREIVFCTDEELRAAAGHSGGLRVGLIETLERADQESTEPPPISEAERAFVWSILVAGAGVAAMADGQSGPELTGSSTALPEKLVAGQALAVEVLLTSERPELAGPEGGRVWSPGFAAVDLAALSGGEVPRHPFWSTSWRCSTVIPTDALLPRLVLRRGRTFVLLALPEATPGGPRGYLPVLDPHRADSRIAERNRSGVFIDRIPTGTQRYVAYAHVLDPLTGQPIAHGWVPTGYEVGGPPSGTPLPPGEEPQMIEVLRDCLRVLDSRLDGAVGDVVLDLAESTYAAALDRVLGGMRSFG